MLHAAVPSACWIASMSLSQETSRFEVSAVGDTQLDSGGSSDRANIPCYGPATVSERKSTPTAGEALPESTAPLGVKPFGVLCFLVDAT